MAETQLGILILSTSDALGWHLGGTTVVNSKLMQSRRRRIRRGWG